MLERGPEQRMQIHVKWRGLGAVFRTGINGSNVLPTNGNPPIQPYFLYAVSCLTMRLNLAFEFPFSSTTPTLGFSSNAVQALACSHVQGP
jgi:hypothetical protein